MAVLPIVTVPDPFLNEKANRVKDFGKELEKIIKDMKDTLDAAREPEGAGLSANQVGIPLSICLVRDFKYLDEEESQEVGDKVSKENLDTETFEETTLINPKMITSSKETEIDWEGCLSIPGLYGKVKRAYKIKIAYMDEKGRAKKLNAKGFFARVIQHEMDHLNGILFTQKTVGNPVTEEYFNNLLNGKQNPSY